MILSYLSLKKTPTTRQIFCLFVCLFDKKQQYNNQFVYFLINTGDNNINLNLINGIMLIHPIILYMLYATIASNVLIQLYIYKKKLIKNYENKNFLEKFLLLFILLTFFFGCYWAEQELFWGG